MRTASGIFIGLLALFSAACAQDLYQQRTALMKTHIRNFYQHLQADHVMSAVVENEKLEGLASTIGAEIRQSRDPFAANRVNRDWVQLKTANQAAADNWLNLGRYFLHHKRYEEARGAYRRVLNTYHDEDYYRPYVEQAQAGLQDVEMILNPSRTP